MQVRRNRKKPDSPDEALRQHEKRFRSFVDLSTESYWEQDENHRFTLITGGALENSGFDPKGFLGATRWDHGAVPAADGGSWDEHKATLEARRPFAEFVSKCVNSRGELRYLCASGQPIFDGKKRFKGYRGTLRDVTQRVQMDLRLAIEHGVTRVLEESNSIAEASPRILRVICETLGWACGARWAPDKDQALRCTEAWGVAAPGIDEFLEITRHQAPSTRVGGLNRRTWAERKPQWIRDVTKEATFRRAPDAIKAGLHSAFAFPIKVGAQVTGVMEFFSWEIHQPDAELLDCMTYVGSQIGQFAQRKTAEEEMSRFRLAMDNSADMIALVDRATMRFVDVNETECKLLGYSREELLRMGPEDVLPISRAELERVYDEFIANPSRTIGLNSHYRCKDGSLLPFESSRRILRSGDDHIIVVISRDIRRRMAAEKELRESEERFRSLTQLSSDLYWEQDEQFRFTSIKGAGSARVNTLSFPELGKKHWEQNYLNMTADAWAEHIALLEAHKPFRDMELCRLDETGKKVWISVSGEPIFDSSGAFKGYRGVGKDITVRKANEERIHFLANHDALTGLHNRAMFTEVLNLAIQNARRYNRSFAVLFIDLDRFKIINDTLGHEAGDKLLQEMGTRLTHTVRSSDVVARLWGAMNS